MYTESLTAGQATSQMLLLLKRPVQCALCGREFNRVTPGHIRMHAEYLRSKRGLRWYRPKQEPTEEDGEDIQSSLQDQSTTWKSRDETLMETYERLFGGKDELSSCVKKLLDLYQPHRGKWLVMDKPVLPVSAATWYQVTSDNPAFRPNRLCVSILKEHLRLKCTVGVFPKSQYETHFVTWDIDAKPLYDDSSWSPTDEARNAALAASGLLRSWGLHAHVIISGKKGYHVTVFFSTAVPMKVAVSLFKAVVQHSNGPRLGPGLKVECLPVGRGNKLPLGIHWSADRYCGFVDPYTLEPLLNPYDYLLNIRPDSPAVLFDIADEGLAQRECTSTVIEAKSWSKDATEAAYKVGIIAPGTRHDTLLRVAAHIRNTPSLCPESLTEFIQVLVRWSRKQYERNSLNIGTSWSEHVKDVHRVAKYAWKRPLTPGVPQDIRITAATVHWIRSETFVLSEQQLLFAAWFEMSQVGTCFHFGYKQAQRMTALANESLDKAFKGLRSKGVLVVESEYFHGGHGIVPSKTRQYRLSNLPPSTAMAILVALKPNKWVSSLWFSILRSLFTVEELKVSYPFAYHRILRSEPLPIRSSIA